MLTKYIFGSFNKSLTFVECILKSSAPSSDKNDADDSLFRFGKKDKYSCTVCNQENG